MKKLFLSLLLIFPLAVFACSCSIPKILDLVASSDFVATAKILSITQDSALPEYHNIEIELIDLYKGDHITKLKVHSWSNTSCAFLTPKNSTWLIFAARDRNGNLSFDFCSGSEQVDRKFDDPKYPGADKHYQQSVELKLGLLKYLRDQKIYPENKYEIAASIKMSDLDRYKGIHVLNERFALYKLTIGTDLSIQKIQPLKEFRDEKTKIDLVDFIKDHARISLTSRKTVITQTTEIILGLYYYPPEDDYKSFIGVFDL